MKVLVIGATGGTGQQAVRQLLLRGDQVTAFARRPEAVNATGERLSIVAGTRAMARQSTARSPGRMLC
jgi:uncharacterized protein YbjT (DUF2867 family)